MKSQFACRAASSTSSRVVSGTPYAILSCTLPVLRWRISRAISDRHAATYKSVGSCDTTPMRDLQDSTVKSRISDM
jgi:hypothetical protein